MSKLLNAFNDTAFKIIFGKEKDKDILISFLNALLEGTAFYDPIIDVEYRNNEKVGSKPKERSIVNDIHCFTQHGKHIILEMQNKSHRNFADRMIFYNSKAIVEQAKVGKNT